MPFVQDKQQGDATLGVFVPCDPRIDQASRERAYNIGAMTAHLLAEGIRLPCGSAPGVFYASKLVDDEASADRAATEMRSAGVGALIAVPDTWFFPGRSAMALTAHFPPSTPLACVGGNNAPKPGVVGIDALAGAYAQTGRLCAVVIGSMPESGQNPDYDDATKSEIVDLGYALSTAVALRGKRYLSVDTDSMQMETALNHVHAARSVFGLESTRESMKLFSDMLNKKGGYDPQELEALLHWVKRVRFKDRIYGNLEEVTAEKWALYTEERSPPPPLSAEDEAKLREGLALYLILRDHMQAINAVGGGWTSQLAWGSDLRGTPMATADIAESLFNSTEDHNGPKPVIPFATENDVQGLLTMICHSYLSGGRPTLFMDYRKVYEPWEIEKNACELDLDLTPFAGEPWMQRGFVDGNNSGSASLDFGEEHFLFRADRDYFPGGGFSVGFLSPGGIRGMAGRLAYSALTGMFTMIQDEAVSVALPAPLTERVAHASNYTWPHTFLTFDHIPASLSKVGVPANHLHMVTGMPRRRWQHFSDIALVLPYRWENTPEFTQGLDRPIPMLWRLNGGEVLAKMRLAGCR